MRLAEPLWLLGLLPAAALLYLTLRSARGASLSTPRLRLFLAMRILAIALVIVALGGLSFSRLSDRLSVVFLLDDSRSVGDQQRGEAARIVDRIREKLRPGDDVELARFGANGQIEELEPSQSASVQPAAGVDGTATDIGGAIQFALAQVPTDSSPRIVLLSDGNENRGNAQQAATVAHALGARIFTAALNPAAVGGRPTGPGDVSVENILAPDRVRAGEPQQVTVITRSLTQTQARVTLFRDGEPVASRGVTLAIGENALTFSDSFPDRGLHAWDAVVQAPSDQLSENNHYRRLVEVTGRPQVLYVHRPGVVSDSLLAALATQGVDVVQREVRDLPTSLAGFVPFDAVILDDVPGYGISTEKMETIARYVRDAGGGLLMVGGANSFGPGGYYKTPIERVLPVDMDVKSQVELPRLTMLMVVDKSGSMAGSVPTAGTKLDVVKSAAIAAIELLNPFDRVGILAFDADFQWVVPITDAGNKEDIARELATLEPGGGTTMYPAMEEAYHKISASPSPLRHVIVLTDGLTNPGDFQKLVEQMAREKITVSTVAVGDDADRDLLANIARWGGGRAYVATDPANVPQIFMSETMLVSRGLVVEKPFLPQLVSAGESLRGIPLANMPLLGGLVLTYPKPGSEVVLSALYDAPLLATWQYGLGRTAAFTSDLHGHWSRRWLAWSQFPRFASQLARWIERPTGGDVLHPTISVAGGKASVRVDAYDALGGFVNGLAMEGVVLKPGGGRTEVPITQTGPGLYEGSFDALEVGDYLLTLAPKAGGASSQNAEGGSARGTGGPGGAESPGFAPLTVGVSVPYSDEFRILGVNTDLLKRLAALTGGRVISSADDAGSIAEVTDRQIARGSTRGGPWQILLLAAALLFLADITARRFTVRSG